MDTGTPQLFIICLYGDTEKAEINTEEPRGGEQ
jgi:hypothetical protein